MERRIAWLPIALVALVAMGAAAGSAVGLAIGPHRDEQPYFVYVTAQYPRATAVGQADPQEADYAWAMTHREQMLAEGDRACEWLEGQQDAPAHPDYLTQYNTFGLDRVISRYLRSADMRERIPHTPLGQRTVVAGAWQYLCRDLRRQKVAVFASDD